jgi:hypothetical protein
VGGLFDIAGGGRFVPIEKELVGPAAVEEEAMVEVVVEMVEVLMKIGYWWFNLGAGVLHPRGGGALPPSAFLRPREQERGVFLEDGRMFDASVLLGLEGVRMIVGSEGWNPNGGYGEGIIWVLVACKKVEFDIFIMDIAEAGGG